MTSPNACLHQSLVSRQQDDDDWSDEDEDGSAEIETSTLLGIAGDDISTASDLTDAVVSRIGGYPAFLPIDEPPFASSTCKVCGFPMELLVQMWCPFEDSPRDRALYIWGCSAPACQNKEGSVRAWRGLRFNDEFAAQLKEKNEKKKAKIEKPKPQANPFSVGAVIPGPNPFSLGTQIFGGATSPAPGDTAPEEPREDEQEEESDETDDELLPVLASVTLEDSPWRSAPCFKPVYLNTESEFIRPSAQSKLPPGVQVVDSLDDNESKKGKDVSWMSEAYENSLDVDQVFDRFTKRVAHNSSQCVRYELDGTPLPYASDKIFNSLFPLPPSPPTPVTKAAFTVVPPAKRVYDPASLPVCPVCQSKRVFECQLMPNLINLLASTSSDVENKRMTDDERRKLVEQELKGGNSRGMDWGTCLVFSCSNDCSLDADGKETRDSWREEVVLVQWGV
ncbi:PDCD2-C domain-containing protein [Mycena indigotica]|uniref:PDCD2-C domain-containing protein n=1 Tax=Mycena indigotica TaxID=2126181 RepID=A0A8H6SUV0_9AGAR|nr:PDCD2-C domain-containing protein [Mycena indigotica]KAF7306313.1 PDCD2-C domain-containing protein [Mycena indigotica]